MPRPTKSFNFEELKEIGKPGPSGHDVSIMEFKGDDGKSILGYYKPCEETYPILLAQYVTAFSVALPLTSEDCLVYDKTGKIVGTLSIALDGFQPLLSQQDGNPSEGSRRKRLGVPTKETLLKHKIAYAMAIALFGEDDDRHPGNIGLIENIIKKLFQSINIDLDMYFYGLTSIFKGTRYGTGWWLEPPRELTLEDLKPYSTKVNTHWPGQNPKNLNLLKKYKTTAFDEFKKENNADFAYQWYTGLLLVALTNDDAVLKKRLQPYLGEEKLDLKPLSTDQQSKLYAYDLKKQLYSYLEKIGIHIDKLGPATRELLLNYSQPITSKQLKDLYKTNPRLKLKKRAKRRKFHAFCKRKVKFDNLFELKDQKDISFTEHASLFFAQKYQHFEGLLARLPEFREFLIQFNQTPTEWEDLKQWFQEQTKYTVPYDLKQIEQHYHRLWRDCFKIPIDEQMTKLAALVEKAEDLKPLDHVTEFDTSTEDLGRSGVMLTGPSKPSTTLENDYAVMRKHFIILYKKMCTITHGFYSLPTPSVTDNTEFISNMIQLLEESIEKQEKFLLANQKKLSHCSDFDEIADFDDLSVCAQDLSTEMDTVTKSFMGVLNSFRLVPLEPPKEEPFEDLSETEIHESKLATAEQDTIQLLGTRLKTWVPSLSSSALDSIIEDSQKISFEPSTSDCSVVRFAFWSTSYNQPPVPSSRQISLEEFLSQHPWQTRQTNIIKKLCLRMTDTTPDKVLHQLITGKNDAWWGRVSENIAKIAELKKPPASTATFGISSLFGFSR